MRSGRVGAVLCALVLSGCANGLERDGSAAARMDAGQLVSSLEVEVDSTVTFHLHVTNVSDAPVELEFSSAQRFDFVVRTPEGAEVWRWSAERGFAQVLGSETVPPGETLEYSATWTPAPSREGELVAEAMLTARGREVRQETEFALP